MGIERTGQVVLMIHCGSRGFGHQVATDALVAMEKAMKRDNIEVRVQILTISGLGDDYV